MNEFDQSEHSPWASAAKFTAQLDQENQYSAPMNPVPIPHEPVDVDDPVGFLIDRVQTVVTETAQMGTEPLTTIAGVLAQLYQAQSLRGMEGLLWGIDQKLERMLPGVVASGQAGTSEVDWQQNSLRLSDELDRIARGIRDALDPELYREEIVHMLKDLDTGRFIRHR